MAVIGQQSCGIGAVGPVDLQAFAGGDETKYVVAGNGLAAVGQRVHDPVAAFTKNDQFRIFFWQRPVVARFCFFLRRV